MVTMGNGNGGTNGTSVKPAGNVPIAIAVKTGEIVAEELTDDDKHDGDQVEAILKQVESHIERFFGDGAYDQRIYFADKVLSLIFRTSTV